MFAVRRTFCAVAPVTYSTKTLVTLNALIPWTSVRKVPPYITDPHYTAYLLPGADGPVYSSVLTPTDLISSYLSEVDPGYSSDIHIPKL